MRLSFLLEDARSKAIKFAKRFGEDPEVLEPYIRKIEQKSRATDIFTQFNSPEELKTFALSLVSKSDVKRRGVWDDTLYQGLEKTYEDEHIVIYRASKFADMKILGANTDWCITQRESWKGYESEGVKFHIMISKDLPPKSQYSKVAICSDSFPGTTSRTRGNTSDFWTRTDRKMKKATVIRNMEAEILKHTGKKATINIPDIQQHTDIDYTAEPTKVLEQFARLLISRTNHTYFIQNIHRLADIINTPFRWNWDGQKTTILCHIIDNYDLIDVPVVIIEALLKVPTLDLTNIIECVVQSDCTNRQKQRLVGMLIDAGAPLTNKEILICANIHPGKIDNDRIWNAMMSSPLGGKESRLIEYITGFSPSKGKDYWRVSGRRTLGVSQQSMIRFVNQLQLPANSFSIKTIAYGDQLLKVKVSALQDYYDRTGKIPTYPHRPALPHFFSFLV